MSASLDLLPVERGFVLTFTGELGGSPITLTFTETAPLCH